MLNSAPLDSITLDGIGIDFSYADLAGSISVAVATFADLQSSVAVAAATFVDLRGSISVGQNVIVDSPIATLVVSDYKWMTPTLETAQQQFNVRPYFTCKVYDNSIVPTSILSSPGQPLEGEAVAAPDGSILTVGKIASTSFLGFWRVTDATSAAQWATPTVILDSTTGSSGADGYRSDMPAAITVSDYINGTYSIDVYYWATSGANLVIKHAFSNNGGVTWVLNGAGGAITPNAVTILAATTDNVSVAGGKPYLNDDGTTISRSLFYIKKNAQGFYDIHYQFYNGSGSTYGADTIWSANHANSGDWTLHSLDVFYKSGIYYIAFAGFHNIIESRNLNVNNYGIYTVTLERLTSLAATDVWSAPLEVLTSLSPSPANQNSFTSPRLSYDGDSLWLTFNAVTVTTVKNATISGSVTTAVNYFISQSKDLLNYTYPMPIAFTDGTAFTESIDSRGNYEPYNFVKSSYFWKYQLKITINSNKAGGAGAITGFPIYVNLDDLPDEFFYYTRSDGGDIRMFASDGTTELPYELVSFNQSTKTGELWFKGDITSLSNTDFYIKYGNPLAIAYAANDTYGSQNVWTAFSNAYHFKGSLNDSTASGNTATLKDVTLLSDSLSFAGEITLDSSLSGNTAQPFGKTTAFQKVAQDFVMGPAATAQIDALIRKLANTGSPAANITVAIQSDTAGSPSGTTIASTVLSSTAWNAGTTGSDNVIWTASLTSLVQGTTYWLVFSTASLSDVNFYNMAYDPAASHGHFKSFDGATWNTITGSLRYAVYKSGYAQLTNNIAPAIQNMAVSLVLKKTDTIYQDLLSQNSLGQTTGHLEINGQGGSSVPGRITYRPISGNQVARDTGVNFGDGSYHWITIVRDVTSVRYYVDGVANGTSTSDATGTNGFQKIGAIQARLNNTYSGPLSGNVKDLKFAVNASTITAGWVLAEYNNQFSPSTFYTVGSVTTNPDVINYYLVGSGQLWRYTQNAILGDITNDVLAYSISEQAGQPSSINVQVGNANNKWFGNTPTQPGYQALAKGKQVLLFQGYYNAAGNPEVAPRNTYYIDDIQQNVSANNNDLLISGRDWYKKLKSTLSRFTFNFLGPLNYADIFDTSTVSNWNQVLGNWLEQVNTMTTLNSSGTPDSPGSQDAVIVLSQTPQIKSHSVMSVATQLPNPVTGTTKHVYVYAYWLSTTNWLRLRISTNGTNFDWYVEKNINGTITALDSQTGVNLDWSAGSTVYPILVKKYDYYKYNFVIGYNDALNSGNTGTVYNPGQGVHLPLLIANGTNGEFDLTNAFLVAPKSFTAGTVGFGSNNTQGIFSYFKYFQYERSQNIKEIYQALGVKTGIFDYKPQNVFEDYLYVPTNYTGVFTNPNRLLTMASGAVMKNDAVFSNGEVKFTAKLTPTDPASDYAADFIFRADSASNPQNYYSLSIVNRASDGRVEVRFYIAISGNKFLMTSSTIDYNASPSFNSLDFDLTQFHTYKVVMTDGFMMAFIDKVMVLAWQDNNIIGTYSSGYLGFVPTTNVTFKVKDIIATTFWNQIDTVSVNPGDDFDQAVASVAATVRGWNFSDLFGRFKSILLSSSDPTTYTYQTQISSQKTDNSDKEFVNQILVYGSNGVQATAHDFASIASNGLRDTIIVDYKIQTSQDAQNRANYELIDQNKFNNQSTPKQMNNVGAELFDVITLVDTGSNSSGVNATLRVYAQTIKIGGGNGKDDEYSIELQTGNL